MKKEPLVKQIEIKPWPGQLFVVSFLGCNQKASVEFCLKTPDGSARKIDITHSCAVDALAYVRVLPGGFHILVLRNSSTQGRTPFQVMDTISHECTHAAGYIIQFAGAAKQIKHTDEALAYLVGHIIHEVTRIVFPKLMLSPVKKSKKSEKSTH